MFKTIRLLLEKITAIFDGVYLTKSEGLSEISESREVLPPENREVIANKSITDSFACPYCSSQKFQKRGFRQKKRERVQLYLCLDCRKTFTPHITKGKHYPLATMLDALCIYHLGYSLEQTCRIVNKRNQQKTTLSDGSLTGYEPHAVTPDPSNSAMVTQSKNNVNRGVDPRGVAPLQPGLTDPERHWPGPTPKPLSQIGLSPSTLANWLCEHTELLPFARMREYALKRYAPKDMVAVATLVHQQLYRYRFHRAKSYLCIEEYQHRKFVPVRDFLEAVPSECPHQYFQEGLRASEAPLMFSKTQMIVRGKTNYATRMAGFVLQSVTQRKGRHEAIQKFFLACDSVTVATEVPVYLTKDDLEHMKTQLGFELFGEMPKLITGHIDLLQIRNGMIHILDYKPNAEKEKPIEQLTLYAMALSRLTGLRLFEFKCAWFDEKDYFEFYPLHVLHKTKKAGRRRNITTKEGVYEVNRDQEKIHNIRPVIHA